MSENSSSYHEPYDLLSQETKDMHRALVTVMEELEAIDWYQQRAEACGDDDLREILLHNKNEEVEHAMMTIEWIRRHNQRFDEQSRAYLYSTGPITTVEERAMGRAGEGAPSGGSGGKGGNGGDSTAAGSLGIGSLRGGKRA